MANFHSIKGNEIEAHYAGGELRDELDLKADNSVLGILGVNEFTIVAGSSHSSLSDYVGGLNIKSGDTFIVNVLQTAPYPLTFYTFASDPPVYGAGTSIGAVSTAEGAIRVTASGTIKSIGISQGSKTGDNTIMFAVCDADMPYFKFDHEPPHPALLSNGTYDLNSFYEYGYYSFSSGATYTNAPFDLGDFPSSVCTLDVYELGNNKAGYQVFKSVGNGAVWMRYFSGNHASFNAWKGYYLTHGANGKTVNASPAIDFNDMTIADTYMIATSSSHAHSPYGSAMCMLEVKTRSDGVINQVAWYPRVGRLYVRQRDSSSVWTEWFDLAPQSGGLLDIDFTVPMPNKVALKKSISRNSGNNQDIAVYDGHVFDFGEGVMSVDGGEDVSITNGHGNNCNFGTELHGDFPYLYCGSWVMDECEVYVNQVTASSATLIDTISFPTLSGHLNCAVDEDGGKMYILLNKSQSTAVGDIDFIVADLTDGSIISQDALPFAIPVIQGMDFVNGAIYVSHGGASGYTENHILVLDTDGRILANTADISQLSEIEGVAFDGGTMYVAAGSKIYH